MDLIVIELSESTLLYLYSTFIQANAAILAVYGFYITYRIQSLQSTIEIIKSDLIRNQAMDQPIKIYEFDLASIEDKRRLFNARSEGEYFFLHFKIWLEKAEIISHLKTYIIFPTILLAFAMILDSLFLLTSVNLYHYYLTFSTYLAYMAVLFHILIWALITINIISVIKSE